jgi:hypothetical protein
MASSDLQSSDAVQGKGIVLVTWQVWRQDDNGIRHISKERDL